MATSSANLKTECFPLPWASSFGTWISGTPAPLECLFQTVFERHARSVPEECPGLGNIRLRIAHIAGARLLVDRRDVRADELVEHADEIVQRNAQSGRDVDH